MNSPCPSFDAAEGHPLSLPKVVSSGDSGVLEFDLVVDFHDVTYDWLTWTTRAYNNDVPGPTIMVKRGDKLKINLIAESRGKNERRNVGCLALNLK